MFHLLVEHTSQISHKHLHHVAQSLDGANAVKLRILSLICPDIKRTILLATLKCKGMYHWIQKLTEFLFQAYKLEVDHFEKELWLQ